MDNRIAKVASAMMTLYAGDAKRIHHFLKVHSYAAFIATEEAIDDETRFVLEATALTHDVGIHAAEAKYGNCNGHNQEIEGPPIARQMLTDLGLFSPAQVDRICFLIGHHHTYNAVDGIDYQILLEADFLVNAYEDCLSKDEVDKFVAHVFKTQSGKRAIAQLMGE